MWRGSLWVQEQDGVATSLMGPVELSPVAEFRVAIFQVKPCKPQVLTFYRDFLKGSTRAGDFKAVFKTV